MKKYLVGVFDSGIGGLTVLSECVRRLPDCDYLYFGDNAHAPYGSRSPEEITSLVRTALRVRLDAGRLHDMEVFQLPRSAKD